MKVYLDLLEDILTNGVKKQDRTGTGTIGVFGRQYRVDLSKGFPLLTTKKLHWKSIAGELIWMLSGSVNNNDLVAKGVHIWDEWAKPNGDLGPIYSKQWRAWNTGRDIPTPDKDGHIWHLPESIDQISELINNLLNNPNSRRHVVSAWNVADLPRMSLAPCHCLFQMNCRPMTPKQRLFHAIYETGNIALALSMDLVEDNIVERLLATTYSDAPKYFLDCQLYQRSCDTFLGVPYNTASYSLLTHMLADQCNMIPGEFIHTFGDTHLYLNHIEQAKLQLSREPRPLPTLRLTPRTSIFDYVFEDCVIENYDAHPTIKAAVSV